jgi:hypothetical protein
LTEIPNQCERRLLLLETSNARQDERLTIVEAAQDAFREAVWKCVIALLSATGLALLHLIWERLVP